MNPLMTDLGRTLAYLMLHPPRRRPHRDPGTFGLPWKEVALTTRDGIRLACWQVGPASDAVAVVGHGIGQGKAATLANAQFLVERGFQVLMFDHRGHGQSQADRRAWHIADRFTEDILACVRWAQDRPEPPRKLIVCGFSFSTFPTVYALADGSAKIDKTICESGPGLDLAAMFNAFFVKASTRSTLLGRLMRSTSLRCATARAAVDMLGATWPPAPDAGQLGRVPQLYLIGDHDTVIRTHEVRQLVVGWPNAELHELTGGHLHLIDSADNAYRSIIAEFLER